MGKFLYNNSYRPLTTPPFISTCFQPVQLGFMTLFDSEISPGTVTSNINKKFKFVSFLPWYPGMPFFLWARFFSWANWRRSTVSDPAPRLGMIGVGVGTTVPFKGHGTGWNALKKTKQPTFLKSWRDLRFLCLSI